MRKIYIPLFTLAISLAYVSCENMAQIADAANQANEILNTTTGGDGENKPTLSSEEMVAGLKEALTVGIKNGANLASQTDGFFKNSAIKIPFPSEAQEVKDKAIKWGMGDKIEQFELTLNRAAEEASKEAIPIFVNAIKNMTIADAKGILTGADNAATEYLKKSTSSALEGKFKPIVHDAIEKVQVTKYWNPVISKYNMIPGVEKKDPDLDNYVTKRAMKGLFYLVEQEEAKIRKDPLARVTDTLAKVFGYVFED